MKLFCETPSGFENLTTSKTQQFCETSSMFEVDNVKNEAILRDIFNFWTWQRQKRSNSATLPHFSKLTTSKTKQFRETSFKNGRAVRRWGRWFAERGCILEHQIFRFAEMILRDRCSTSYDLASLFRGRRSTLDRWSGKIAKRIGTRPSALHSTFHIRSLAELLCFWCCQLRKMKKSQRIVSFWMVSSSKIEEVSQNCFVLDGVKFKNWESVAKIAAFSSLQTDRQTDR